MSGLFLEDQRGPAEQKFTERQVMRTPEQSAESALNAREVNTRRGERKSRESFSTRRRDEKCSVYFIECAGTRHVKIGISDDVYQRLDALQTSNPMPLTLLAHFPGGPQDERRLHHRFAKYRVKGEWFRFEDELEDYVVKLKSSQEADPLRGEFVRAQRGARPELLRLIDETEYALSVARRMQATGCCRSAPATEVCGRVRAPLATEPVCRWGGEFSKEQERAVLEWVRRRLEVGRIGLDPIDIAYGGAQLPEAP